MTALVLVARYILVVLFAVAAATKLVAPARWWATLDGLGIPRRLLAALAIAVPLTELGVAGLLAFDATVSAGAIAAVALLTVFIAVVANAVARGRKPDCNCFGKAGSSELGWHTVGRNALLLALAALVLWNPPVDLTAAALIAAGALLVIAGQAWFGLQLLRQNGRVLARVAVLEQAAGATIPVSATTVGAPALPETVERRPAAAAGGAVAAAALAAAAPALARRDAETDQIKAILSAGGPVVSGDLGTVSRRLADVSKSRKKRPSLRRVHEAIAEQSAHQLEFRNQLAALAPTAAEALAARDAAIVSLDYLMLASAEFDRMIEIPGKRKRKRSRKKAHKLLEHAAAAGFYANVGLGCPGEGC